MSILPASIRGVFWLSLETARPAECAAFYSWNLGFDIHADDDSDDVFWLRTPGDVNIIRVSRSQENDSRWTPYFATTQPAEEPDSNTKEPRTFTDPEGVEFGIVQAADTGSLVQGRDCLIERSTHQRSNIDAYFSTALGMTSYEIDDALHSVSYMISERRVIMTTLDLSSVGDQQTAPRWTPYFKVADLDWAVANAIETGAQGIVVESQSYLGPFTLLRDPFGTVFGIEGSLDRGKLRDASVFSPDGEPLVLGHLID